MPNQTQTLVCNGKLLCLRCFSLAVVREETPVISLFLQTHAILAVQFIGRNFQSPFYGNYSSMFQVINDNKQIFAEHRIVQQRTA